MERRFKDEEGIVLTETFLRDVSWPMALEQEGVTASEYSFEDYLFDCHRNRGGALVEIDKNGEEMWDEM